MEYDQDIEKTHSAWGPAMKLSRFLRIGIWVAVLASAPVKAAPGLSLQPFSPELEPVTTLDGQPRLLQFWASWCRSCFHIMEDIERVSEGFPAVTYMAVSIDENMAEPAAALVPRPAFANHPERFWFDEGAGLSQALGIITTPTLVLLDANGAERHRHLGHLNATDLQTLRRKLQTLNEERK